jgi:hypothetical protein
MGKILCPRKPRKKWFNLDCVKCHYIHCGIKRLPVCDKELDSSNLSVVEWRAFKKFTAIETKDGD